MRRGVLFCESLEPRQFLTTVPAGFDVSTVVSGLANPTAMAFAPDGRLFVTEQGGSLRVVKDGQLLPTPFLSLPVSSVGERGLLGVAFDPDFATDHFVYVYYTATTPVVHNRVSRFTADGDVAAPGSEDVLLDLPPLIATNHNGGAIHFGPDGKLYVAVGENARAQLAPGLDTVFGKILRINPDGSVPSDNPFLSQTTGLQQTIWAKGLRNPFTFAFQPGTGLMLIDDVGQNSTEEIDVGQAGADYGWPSTEGDPHGAPGITAPVYTYTHDQGIAIIGGAFMPDGHYYFGDLSGNFVRALDPATDTVTPFATNLPTLVGLTPGPDNQLYLLTRESGGEVMKVTGDFGTPPTPQVPTVTIAGVPDGFQYVAGKTVKLTLSGADAQGTPLSKKSLGYRIDRVVNGVVTKTEATGKAKASVKFKIPTKTVTPATTFRVTLTGRDPAGAVATATLDLPPKVRTLFASASDGSSSAQLDDGSGETIIGDGHSFSANVVVGTRHRLTAAKFGDPGRNAYAFDHWEGAKRTHKRTFEFTVPDGAGDLGYTARYRQLPP